MKNKPPVYINQILNLTVDRLGKNNDFIFMYKNFVIFLKSENKLSITLNEFVRIRIVKILPNFALAVLATESIKIAKCEVEDGS